MLSIHVDSKFIPIARFKVAFFAFQMVGFCVDGEYMSRQSRLLTASVVAMRARVVPLVFVRRFHVSLKSCV